MAPKRDQALETLSHLDPGAMALILLGVDNLGAGSRAIDPVYQPYRMAHPLKLVAAGIDDYDEDNQEEESFIMSVVSDRDAETLFDQCATILQKEAQKINQSNAQKKNRAGFKVFYDQNLVIIAELSLWTTENPLQYLFRIFVEDEEKIVGSLSLFVPESKSFTQLKSAAVGSRSEFAALFRSYLRHPALFELRTSLNAAA